MKEWELNDKTYCCLISEIKKIRSFDDEEKYIEKYVYPHRSRTFSQYLREYMNQNNIAVADVMKNSGINRNYGYNIINGTRKKPGRDKVIALCIGAGMDIRWQLPDFACLIREMKEMSELLLLLCAEQRIYSDLIYILRSME